MKAPKSLCASNQLVKLAIVALVTALPIAAFGQNNNQLGNLGGESSLQNRIGEAIGNPAGGSMRGICPKMIDDGFMRTSGGNDGDLFRRCGDLVNTAIFLAGDTPAGEINLDITQDELLEATNSVSHRQMPAIGKGASEITSIHAGAIGDRLYALREGETGVQIAGQALDTQGHRLDFDFELFEEIGAAGDDFGDRRLGGFLTVDGGFGDRDDFKLTRRRK